MNCHKLLGWIVCLFWRKSRYQKSEKWADRGTGETYHATEKMKSKCNFEWMHLNAMNKHKRHILAHSLQSLPHKNTNLWSHIFSSFSQSSHLHVAMHEYYTVLYMNLLEETTIFSLYNLQKRRKNEVFDSASLSLFCMHGKQTIMPFMTKTFTFGWIGGEVCLQTTVRNLNTKCL